MLFFIDETWQCVGDRRVGALGAVAIEHSQYNYFCRSVYGMKKAVLGARELMHSEIKGHRCLSKAAFKRHGLHSDSHWLTTADRLLTILAEHRAKVFVIWTTDPDLLTLRHPTAREIAKPYKQMLFDMRALMENEAPGRLGALNFDLRGTREDEATASAISSYMVRTKGGWPRHFLCIPNFTVSSVSPGLQAADVVAYLGAWLAPSDDRPELKPYVARMRGLTYTFTRSGTSARRVTTARRAG